MSRFLVQRVLHGLVVVLAVVFVLAILVKLVPGDAVDLVAMSNPGFTTEDAVELRDKLGLNRSVVGQFLHYGGAILKGDLGESFRHHKPVWSLLKERIPPTVELTLVALVFALLIAIPLGVVTALRRGTMVDYAGTVFAVLGIATPSFLIGILLIVVFTIELSWLPPSGRKSGLVTAVIEAIGRGDVGVFWDSFRYYIMPSVALALSVIAINTRLIRSTMLEVLRQDFVQFAKAKGLPNRVVYVGHALRNALIPTVTIVGLQIGFMISGAFIVENVFAWPGLGRLAVEAVAWRDYPLLQGTVLITAIFYVVLSIAIDLIYRAIDPRIRYVRH